MPCNSDYLAQNGKEKNFQKAAKLLCYVYDRLGENIPVDVYNTSIEYYAKRDFIPQLCETLKEMSDSSIERIVYNAHSSISRELATW